MSKKGILVEVPSLAIIMAGLIGFTITFALAATIFSPGKSTLNDVDSIASGSRIPEFLEMTQNFEGMKASTLGLLDMYCFNNDEALKAKQLDEIMKRSRLMFNNLFVTAQFECSDGKKINLRDHLCDEPKAFPIISKEDKPHMLYYCDKPQIVVTHDGLVWAQHPIYKGRLGTVTKDAPKISSIAMPDMTINKFRESYAISQ